MIDRARLTKLLAQERATFDERNPRSRQAYADASHLFGRVPMTWMNKRAGSFPTRDLGFPLTSRAFLATYVCGMPARSMASPSAPMASAWPRRGRSAASRSGILKMATKS